MVKEMGEKGRGLVASRDFKVGDLIFKDKSVASIKRKEVLEAEVAEQIHAQITDEQTAQDRDSRAFWPSVSSLGEKSESLSSHVIVPAHRRQHCEIA